VKCPSSEQLAALALAASEREVPAELAAAREHARRCPACAARLTGLRVGLRRVAAAHERFERGHAAERARLLRSLPAAGAGGGGRGPHVLRKGVLTMRRALTGGAAAAAVLAGCFLLWQALQPPSALAQVARAIRDAKSYRCRVAAVQRDDQGKEKVAEVGKLFWAAPGSIRHETYKDDKLAEVTVFPVGKPGLEVDHREESYRRLGVHQNRTSPMMLMARLAAFSGQADRELPARQVGGKKAAGFEVASSKVDPDLVGDGTLRVWADPDSNRPVLVEMQQTSTDPWFLRFERFEWDVPTDKWFDTEPPAKYADKTPAEPTVEEVTADIVNGLKTFAKHSGGKYPQVKIVYGDVTMYELYRNAGLSNPPSAEDTQKEEYSECIKAVRGFSLINHLHRYNPDAAYFGKTVGPEDKDKPLLYWKLDGGEYRVIFGDLKAETVSAEKLKALKQR
jgi:hypothetical protein